MKFYNGETGEQIGAAVIPDLHRIRRSKLRALLAEGIPIQYSKTLSAIKFSENDTAVIAHFEDGSSAAGAILIGADGTRSKVRHILLGPEKAALETLEYAASMIQAKYTAEQVMFLRSLHPLLQASIHPAGLFSYLGLHSAPDPNDPENWIMNHYISWHCTLAEQENVKDWSNEEQLVHLKGLAENFADPFRSAFTWLKDDQQVWYSPLKQWDPSLLEHQWDNHDGRVTLAGDAAHPMTFRKVPYFFFHFVPGDPEHPQKFETSC